MDFKFTRNLAEAEYLTLASLAKERFGFAVSIDVTSLSTIELRQKIEELRFLVRTSTSRDVPGELRSS